MSENLPEEQKGLSPAEREQISYLVRFLAMVLVCVLIASLTVGFIMMIFQNVG